MESITMIQITSVVDSSSIEFYTSYPFAVSKGEYFNSVSFLDKDVIDLIDEDTYGSIEDSNEVYNIEHCILYGMYCRVISISYHLKLSNFYTEIKDGKISTYSSEELREKYNKK